VREFTPTLRARCDLLQGEPACRALLGPAAQGPEGDVGGSSGTRSACAGSRPASWTHTCRACGNCTSTPPSDREIPWTFTSTGTPPEPRSGFGFEGDLLVASMQHDAPTEPVTRDDLERTETGGVPAGHRRRLDLDPDDGAVPCLQRQIHFLAVSSTEVRQAGPYPAPANLLAQLQGTRVLLLARRGPATNTAGVSRRARSIRARTYRWYIGHRIPTRPPFMAICRHHTAHKSSKDLVSRA